MALHEAETTQWRGVSLREHDNFESTSVEQWPSCLPHYEDYDFAPGLAATPEEICARLLLYCMGPQARRLLQSLSLPTDATYDAVVKGFTERLVHPINEVYESYRFHRRVQLPDESVHGFYAKLTRLVKKCNVAM